MTFLEKRRTIFWILVVSLSIIFLGLLDYLTGTELSFSLFYLAPIFLITWFKGRNLGLLFSAISVIAWLIADTAGGKQYSSSAIFVWNTFIRLGFFIIVTLLLSALRIAYKKNQALARLDFVSGAVSVSHFYAVGKIEIERSARYKKPFTFAYIDLDNFKRVNDMLGHSTGDRVLRAVTDHVHGQIRLMDTFARLGGDEFALLLPETDDDEAQSVISRIHSILTEAMHQNGWEVTFSIGAVTYRHPPESVDEMVKLADGIMYTIKTNTKNGVAFHLYAA